MPGNLTIAEAVHRLKGVFLEVPGTRLTVGDAARLSGLEAAVCLDVLKALEDAGFLGQGPDGAFVRKDSR
jgi:hypothetical protein